MILFIAFAAGNMTLAPISNSERDALLNAWKACLQENARNLDDKTSDAASIAQAAASICRPQLHSMADAATRQETPEVRRALYLELERRELDHAIPIILAERRKRRPR